MTAYLGMRLRLRAVRESADVTALVVYDGEGKYVGRLARIDHPEGSWDLLAEMAHKIPAAVLDAMAEAPVEGEEEV